MIPSRSQFLLVGVLLLAATVFGMVIAGGSGITTPGFTAPGPQRVAAGGTTVSLPDFADLAEAVLPAVASVRVVSFERRPASRVSPFDFFFSDPRRPREREGEESDREFRRDGAGSGFVISSDGWMVTNHHVIDGAERVEVTLDGSVYHAEIRGSDPATDLAVLKVDTDEELAYLALGDSEALRVGEWVMAIGNPYTLSQSVTVGVVSAKGRSIGLSNDSSFENYIQTDAAINQGNSGGPLVNVAGEVIGISTAMNYGAENIAFAVPVDTLKGIVGQLQRDGRVRRGYLGVNIQDLEPDYAEAFGVESTDGALVTDFPDDRESPAGDAGIRVGDIIVRVDDLEVEDTRHLIDYVAGLAPGSRVELEVLRNGRTQEIDVVLGERDADEQAVRVEPEAEDQLEWLGLQYQELTPGLRQMHGIGDDVRGVFVVDVAPSSPLVDEGVGPGDVITEVNGEAVTDGDAFTDLVGGVPSGSFLRLYVRRIAGDRDIGRFAIVRAP